MIRYSHGIKLAHMHNPKQQSVIEKSCIIGMTNVDQSRYHHAHSSCFFRVRVLIFILFISLFAFLFLCLLPVIHQSIYIQLTQYLVCWLSLFI